MRNYVLIIGQHSPVCLLITVAGQNVDDVDHFTYLGSILTCDDNAEPDINCRIGKVASVLQCMRLKWTS